MSDLFAHDEPLAVAPDAYLLKGFLGDEDERLLAEIRRLTAISPFRHMQTPGGYRMSAAMSSCGTYGWVSDAKGYRYSRTDPLTGNPWPPLPDAFLSLSQQAAERTGFHRFLPDSCLINCYAPGAGMSLHQDRDEPDRRQPIVSFSLGLPVQFQFGGSERHHPLKTFALEHGDVLVWGGRSRLNYHAVRPVRAGVHPLAGARRFNLTFRCAR